MRSFSDAELYHEQWEPIPGYPNYEASNLGRIRSVEHEVTRPQKGTMTYPSKILKQKLSNAGYLRVCLTDANGKKHQCSVHRCVALAFIPNPQSKREVNHVSGDPLDNRLQNLEWVTPRENILHSRMFFGHRRKKRDPSTFYHRPVIVDGAMRFDSITEAAEVIGVTESALCSVLRGRYLTTHGHTAVYAEEK